MNLSNFKNDVYVNVTTRPSYIRYGQAVYNYVYQNYLEIHDKLPGPMDPFYNDDNAELFLDKCALCI